jgi:hypothetical protein
MATTAAVTLLVISFFTQNNRLLVVTAVIAVVANTKKFLRRSRRRTLKKSKKTKLLLFVGLILSSCAVFAEEWQTYFESDKFYFYLAPNSTQRAGDNIITQTIHDFKTPSDRAERSRQITREYDCARAQSRVLKMVTYSKEKAAGQIIRDEAEVEAWAPIAPNSAVAALGNIVCKTK